MSELTGRQKKVDIFLIGQMACYMDLVFNGRYSIMYVSMLIGIVSFINLYSENKELFKRFIVLEILSVILLYSNASHMVTTFSVLCTLFSFYSTAWLLLVGRFSEKYTFAISLMFCIISIYRIVFYGTEIGNLYSLSSHNWISIYFTVFTYPYYIAKFKVGEKPNLIPAVLCVLMSFVSQGRGNIIFSLILLLGLLLDVFMVKNIKNKKITKFAICILFMFLLFYISTYFDVIFNNYLSRFTEKIDFESEERSLIFMGYISEMVNSWHSFVFGIDYRPFVNVYIEHLHNSFLMTHHCMGIFALLALLYMIPKGILTMLHRGCVHILIISIAFVVKSIFEWAYPTQLGDIIIVYIILLPFTSYEVYNNSKHSITIHK